MVRLERKCLNALAYLFQAKIRGLKSFIEWTPGLEGSLMLSISWNFFKVLAIVWKESIFYFGCCGNWRVVCNAVVEIDTWFAILLSILTCSYPCSCGNRHVIRHTVEHINMQLSMQLWKSTRGLSYCCGYWHAVCHTVVEIYMWFAKLLCILICSLPSCCVY